MRGHARDTHRLGWLMETPSPRSLVCGDLLCLSRRDHKHGSHPQSWRWALKGRKA